MPEPEALKGFQVEISRFLDFSSLLDNTTPLDQGDSIATPARSRQTHQIRMRLKIYHGRGFHSDMRRGFTQARKTAAFYNGE